MWEKSNEGGIPHEVWIPEIRLTPIATWCRKGYMARQTITFQGDEGEWRLTHDAFLPYGPDGEIMEKTHEYRMGIAGAIARNWTNESRPIYEVGKERVYFVGPGSKEVAQLGINYPTTRSDSDYRAFWDVPQIKPDTHDRIA